MGSLGDLVGVPWLPRGRTPAGADCIGLALLAQRELWGRDYPAPPYDYSPDEPDKLPLEEEIYLWLPSVCDPADGAEAGGLVVMRLAMGGVPYLHIGTFVLDLPLRILHILPGRRSRLDRFDRRERLAMGYFVPRR